MVDNTKMDISEIQWEGMDFHLAQKPLSGCCEHNDEPFGYTKCGKLVDLLSNC
jgi:hypothetical protein